MRILVDYGHREWLPDKDIRAPSRAKSVVYLPKLNQHSSSPRAASTTWRRHSCLAAPRLIEALLPHPPDKGSRVSTLCAGPAFATLRGAVLSGCGVAFQPLQATSSPVSVTRGNTAGVSSNSLALSEAAAAARIGIRKTRPQKLRYSAVIPTILRDPWASPAFRASPVSRQSSPD